MDLKYWFSIVINFIPIIISLIFSILSFIRSEKRWKETKNTRELNEELIKKQIGKTNYEKKLLELEYYLKIIANKDFENKLKNN